MRPRRVFATHYILALVLPVVAFFVRYSLTSNLPSTPPYLGFFLATLATAAVGGAAPGAIAGLLGLFLAGRLLPDGGWLHIVDPQDPTAAIRYLISSGSVVATLRIFDSS
ncbi:MAG: hypothetical protein WDO18_12200 [Acidobacteriota bacterium]